MSTDDTPLVFARSSQICLHIRSLAVGVLHESDAIEEARHNKAHDGEGDELVAQGALLVSDLLLLVVVLSFAGHPGNSLMLLFE